MRIHWSEKYNTGQILIDTEHRMLVMLFKKLDVAIKTKQSDAMLARTVSEVRKFVDFHFTSEENLMLETGYPCFDAHQKLHTNLMVELNSKISRVVSHREYPDDLLDFLSRWLINHIAAQDQHLAKHILNSNERPFAESDYINFLENKKNLF